MLRYLIGGLIVAGLLALLIVLGMSMAPDRAGDPRRLAHGAVAAFEFRGKPYAAPDTRFLDDEGKEVRLADFKGKVLLVNLWATWCAPCKVEMPTLDALQAELGGEDFQVIAISNDFDAERPRRFLAQQKLDNIALHIDRESRMAGWLNAQGLPYTIVVDRRSRMVGHLAGPADWNTPEAKALLRHFIEE